MKPSTFTEGSDRELTTLGDGCGWLRIAVHPNSHFGEIEFFQPLTSAGLDQLIADMGQVAGISADDWVYYPDTATVKILLGAHDAPVTDASTRKEQEVIATIVGLIRTWPKGLGLIEDGNNSEEPGVIDPHREWYATHEAGLPPAMSE
ncbi:hypothetical protein KC878_01045 [Candidatus Saccharibacteria bacterium]|nr:hypothetical protein [Candidatus Saccharibacteria bacterium]MCB9821150.1 hypothetical protein [Candidatus Nomurabacteria bacterium]